MQNPSALALVKTSPPVSVNPLPPGPPIEQLSESLELIAMDDGLEVPGGRRRKDVLETKKRLKSLAGELAETARGHRPNSPERNHLYKGVQQYIEEQDMLETMLKEEFVPQHAAGQLISPRAFFQSPLFRVCNKAIPRLTGHVLEILGARGKVLLRYEGPELRQSDGMVFMALLNLTRDARLGQTVRFNAEDLCKQIFGRYDGPSRSQLKDHIKRLQRGIVEVDKFSVQLCQRFDFPSRGPWAVALDKDIVQIFKQSPYVWIDLARRQGLPEGLPTWLYGFIESQTRLIPIPVESLRRLCGSEANAESFVRTLRNALKALSTCGVIDSGWSIKKSAVHWKKVCETAGAQQPQQEQKPAVSRD